ncbi:MAG: hypothetical protein IKY41_07975 [Clostridia bacterium]|nr:hypothetical protein [Clostridia bacterium]
MKRHIIKIVITFILIFVFFCSSAITSVVYSAPECSCGNSTVEDLIIHADGCARKAYCRDISSKTPQELFDLWREMPEDVRGFLLTYLSWTNQQKLQVLKELLNNYTDDDPSVEEEIPQDGCICENKSAYGSISHDIKCPYHFVNISTEDAYIVFITMSSDMQAEALSLFGRTNKTKSDKKAELEAYIAEHPFVNTKAEDGTSVTASDVPSGASVSATVADAEFTEKNILPGITIADNVDFSLDIKVYDSEGNPYQPKPGDSVMVKVSDPSAIKGDGATFLHILDTSASIEKGLNDGTVKLLDVSGFDETNLPSEYLASIIATTELGYEKQIAYEFISGTCIDDGYYTFYTNSFSAYSNTNFTGNYTIPHNAEDWYIGPITVTGTNAVIQFNRGNVIVNGTITINQNAKLTVKFHDTPWGHSYSILRNPNFKGAFFHNKGTLVINGGSKNVPDLLFVIDGRSYDGTTYRSVDANDAAIRSEGLLNLQNVVIQNCNNPKVNGGSAGHGGGIHILNGNANQTNTLKNVQIKNCTALQGGGIQHQGRGKLQMDDVTIENCSAIHGTALMFPGHDTEIRGNLTANDCKFINNKTPGDYFGDGGTIRTNGNTAIIATFNDCEFANNYSDGYGGAFYWNAGKKISSTTDSMLNINSCNIHDNKAYYSGGAIFCEAFMAITGNTKIYNNHANGTPGQNGIQQNGGGAIGIKTYENNNTKNMPGTNFILSENIEIYNNTTDGYGGAIWMFVKKSSSMNNDATFNFQLNGAKLTNNSACYSGGAVYMHRETDNNYSCSVLLDYGELNNNKALNSSGGGVFTENFNINIGNNSSKKLIISGNTAKEYAGAVYATGAGVACSITNGELTSNSAENGGAIACVDGTVNVNGGLLKDNTATQYGGAVYVQGNNVNFNISDGTISYNKALYGGGIYSSGQNANVNVLGNGLITYNNASNGGGIYVTHGSSVNVTGGYITYNSARGIPNVTTAYNDVALCGVGGGIYVGNGNSDQDKSTISISGNIGIYENHADFAAADAYASGFYTTVTLPTVSGMNLSGYDGTATGWYEDYANGDTNYSYGLKESTEGVRYANARNAKAIGEITSDTSYIAITIGTDKKGFGNLTIYKTGDNIDPKQNFVFKITGRDFDAEYIEIFVSIQGAGSTTIYNLRDGTYTVEEVTSWSWRYEPQEVTINGSIGEETPEIFMTFNNSFINNNWLSTSDKVVNVKSAINTLEG